MRFRFSFTLVCLLATLVLTLGMAAQQAPSQNLQSLQAAFASGEMQADCSQQLLGPRGLPPRRLGLSGIMNRHCKPVLAGAETSQPSNEVARHDDGGTYITFDVPGSKSTGVAGINLWGTIAGSYVDANSVGHGYLRKLNGSITSFDVPGSVHGTGVGAINDVGEVTGTYRDADFLSHGFLRRADGAITTFDVPGSLGLGVREINDAGVIAGNYFDENFIPHSFLRARDGTITTFDVPGAVNGTFVDGLNLLGATTGAYENEDFVDHGFVRSPNGAITSFDVLSGEDTHPFAINLLGTAIGEFREEHPEVNFWLWRGFIRKFDGTIETFDAVQSPLVPCCTWTTPRSINLTERSSDLPTTPTT
jgi:hypothetical protein